MTLYKDSSLQGHLDGLRDIYLSGSGDLESEVLPLHPGDEITNRFVIEGICGEGRYGVVYKAFDSVEKMTVGLKASKRLTAEQIDIQTAFVREVKICRALKDCTHVRRAFAAHALHVDNSERVAISMEFANDGSLRSWLAQRSGMFAADRNEAIALIVGICRGLNVLHVNGVSNIDLKPENVLIVDSRAKLADYGMAHISPESGIADIPDLELPFNLRGTAAYTNPEYSGSDPDAGGAANDLYAFGRILEEMAAACPALWDVGSHGSNGSNRNVRSLQEVIDKAMFGNIGERYPDAGTMLCDIQHWEASVSGDHSRSFSKPRTKSYEQGGIQVDDCVEENLPVQASRAESAQVVAANEIYDAIARDGSQSNIQWLRARMVEIRELCPCHPGLEALQRRHEAACQECKRLLHKAEAAASKMDWIYAARYLRSARRYIPEDPSLLECLAILDAINRCLKRALRTHDGTSVHSAPVTLRAAWVDFHSSLLVDEACLYLVKTLPRIGVRP